MVQISKTSITQRSKVAYIAAAGVLLAIHIFVKIVGGLAALLKLPILLLYGIPLALFSRMHGALGADSKNTVSLIFASVIAWVATAALLQWFMRQLGVFADPQPAGTSELDADSGPDTTADGCRAADPLMTPGSNPAPAPPEKQTSWAGKLNGGALTVGLGVLIVVGQAQASAKFKTHARELAAQHCARHRDCAAVVAAHFESCYDDNRRSHRAGRFRREYELDEASFYDRLDGDRSAAADAGDALPDDARSNAARADDSGTDESAPETDSGQQDDTQAGAAADSARDTATAPSRPR